MHCLGCKIDLFPLTAKEGFFRRLHLNAKDETLGRGRGEPIHPFCYFPVALRSRSLRRSRWELSALTLSTGKWCKSCGYPTMVQTTVVQTAYSSSLFSFISKWANPRCFSRGTNPCTSWCYGGWQYLHKKDICLETNGRLVRWSSSLHQTSANTLLPTEGTKWVTMRRNSRRWF